MTTKQELIEEANKRYKTKEKIACLEGKYKAYNGMRTSSDSHYRFNGNHEEDFYYDEKEDTLCNWGRGIGLIYRKGQWALKEGEERKSIDNYEIY